MAGGRWSWGDVVIELCQQNEVVRCSGDGGDGVWLQEVVERAGGSSSGGMQHFIGRWRQDRVSGRFTSLMGSVSSGGGSNDRDGGAFHVCAEGQTAALAVNYCTAREKKSSEVGMMAMECGARSAQ